MDRCVMRSLCHLDARDDPLPADCPVLGAYASRPPRPAMSEDELQKAETGGSKGMLAAWRRPFSVWEFTSGLPPQLRSALRTLGGQLVVACLAA